MRFHVSACVALTLCGSFAAATHVGSERPLSSLGAVALREEPLDSEVSGAMAVAAATARAAPPPGVAGSAGPRDLTRSSAKFVVLTDLAAPELPSLHVPDDAAKLEETHLVDKGPALLQRSNTHHRKAKHMRAFRQPRRIVEDKTDLVFGVPKLVWVILADILANAMFVACIPLIMFLSKRRRPNFDEPSNCVPGCCPWGQGPPKHDRMSV